MTEDLEGLITSISMNQIIVALLDQYGKLTVPTVKFLDASMGDRELVVDYDEEGPSFTFSLRDKNGQQSDSN